MDSTITTPTVPNLSRRFRTFLHALAFVLGFSLFFLGMGGAATVLGQLFAQYKAVIGQLGGVVVVAFGLATLGVLKIPWFYYDTRPEWDPTRRYGLASSGFMGVFFAAGWSPCIGTTLGAILTLGFNQGNAWQAMFLSSGYAIGLGIPFLIIGFGMDRAFELVRRLRRYMRPIQLASGWLMIIIGLLLASGKMTLISI